MKYINGKVNREQINYRLNKRARDGHFRMRVGCGLTRIAAARNYRFFHARPVARLSMIISIVYYNNYATYLANRFAPQRYEVLTTVSQTTDRGSTTRKGAHRLLLPPEVFSSDAPGSEVYRAPPLSFGEIISVICPTIYDSGACCCSGMTRGKIVHILGGPRTSAVPIRIGTFIKAGTFLTGLLRHRAIIRRARALNPERKRERSLARFAVS